MKLHNILLGAGILLCMAGVALLDSKQASIPVTMIAASLIISITAARADGTIGGKKGGEEE